MTTPEPSTGPENPAPRPSADRDIAHTRSSATLIGWIVGVLVTILLLVFILQNLTSQSVHFFTLTADVPVGVSLLIAAIAGALITAALSGARLVQLRRALRRAARRDGA
ncbi:LapA family protein [Gordonia shandongensis]|uniref:LapA family protein n=1 Tax=Gordonia shandongensis TaxID=376351 RepID=UPI0006848F54|nr:lipopolysaccharide assembly protein LapA domain-containing protein [Gordonia shandongensis]